MYTPMNPNFLYIEWGFPRYSLYELLNVIIESRSHGLNTAMPLLFLVAVSLETSKRVQQGTYDLLCMNDQASIHSNPQRHKTFRNLSNTYTDLDCQSTADIRWIQIAVTKVNCLQGVPSYFATLFFFLGGRHNEFTMIEQTIAINRTKAT